HPDPVAVPLLEPGYVFLRAVTRHVVEHQDASAPRRQRIGYVASNKSAAAGDQNRRGFVASSRRYGVHATSPRDSSSAVARSTRSSAILSLSHSASSSSPRRKSTCGT